MVNDIMMAREEEYEHEDGRYFEYVSDMYYGLTAPPGPGSRTSQKRMRQGMKLSPHLRLCIRL